MALFVPRQHVQSPTHNWRLPLP